MVMRMAGSAKVNMRMYQMTFICKCINIRIHVICILKKHVHIELRKYVLAKQVRENRLNRSVLFDTRTQLQ